MSEPFLTRSATVEPWLKDHRSSDPQSDLESIAHSLLVHLGEDPQREGLLNTPKRVSKMLQELTVGYQHSLQELVNGAVFSSAYEEIVLVKDIEFHSLCEHHLLPFYGRAHCAYIPDGRVIGLSKIPRIVDMFARRLQIQEEFTRQVAHAIEQVIRPLGVAVVIEGVHMCSVMRGVKKSQASMTTSVFLGEFKTDLDRRKEFLHLLQR